MICNPKNFGQRAGKCCALFPRVAQGIWIVPGRISIAVSGGELENEALKGECWVAMTLLLWLSLPLIPIDTEKPGWSLASVVPFCATEFN